MYVAGRRAIGAVAAITPTVGAVPTLLGTDVGVLTLLREVIIVLRPGTDMVDTPTCV